ncbi:angiomotin-like protein 1 isoform X2 [Ornithodoros turicata]|uniref:angiomotin-like protein 1 isoform X2 n=1 Tax=Ornithodoros turicata TaxID=34597 RepID=UPI0031398F01
MKSVRTTTTSSFLPSGQMPFYQMSGYCQSCSGSETDVSTSTENLTSEERHALRRGERQDPQGQETLAPDELEDAASRSNTLVIRNNSSIDGFTSPLYGKSLTPERCISLTPAPVREITDIPKHYLDQSEVLKHLAKEVHNQRTHRRGSSLSQSHPDLTQVGGACKDAGASASEENATKVVNQLLEENAALKAELDLYYGKASRLQKLELELQKVQQAQEELVRTTEKREKLQAAMRARLELERAKAHDMNRRLREQLDAALSQLSLRSMPEHNDAELKKEVSRRDVLIAQLLTQNKELSAEKERKDIELQAQRATLQEQRNHIDILDNALNNAQANVVRMEEECRKKQFYVERVNQLQKALGNLQLANERRLQMEKRCRSQLERDVETLKTEGKAVATSKKESEDTEHLRKVLREYEEKIIALENEVARWEQRYLEESTMRQIAVDAASVPKDAKIAALERTSQESEKLIAQVRSEKLKQMDELYASQRKCAEQEGKLKDMESRLAEKEAMIKVLQHHSQEKDAALQSAVLGRPRHTRAASSVPLGSSTASVAVAHRRTGSKDEIGSSSLAVVSSESTSNATNTVTSQAAACADAKRSIDEQLKEFGSRLSNKFFF